MKKFILSLMALVMCSSAFALTDVTSTYIVNADFSSTDGWTAVVSGQYRDYGSGLIGSYGVRTAEGQSVSTVDDTHLATEYCLGFQCRWDTNFASYTQDIQLPAGNYVLSFDVENTNPKTSALSYVDLCYVALGSTKIYSSSTEWMNGQSAWTTHTISFTLDADATATISFGYGTGTNNVGAGVTPTMHVSHLVLSTDDSEKHTVSLVNADFETDEAVTQNVCGYGKDMANNNTTLYGAQPVTGWTNESVGATDSDYENNAVMGATFAYGSSAKLCGNQKTAPASAPGGSSQLNALGIAAVWGCKVQYTQPLTLARGSYKVTYAVYNQSGTNAVDNLIGFIPDEGTATYDTNTTWEVGTWTFNSFEVTVEEETSGKLSIGYQSKGSGSGANPHLFFDYIMVENVSFELGDPEISVEDGATVILDNTQAIYITFPNTQGMAALEDPQVVVSGDIYCGEEVVSSFELSGSIDKILSVVISGLTKGETYTLVIPEAGIRLYDGTPAPTVGPVLSNDEEYTIRFYIASDSEVASLLLEEEIEKAQEVLEGSVVGVNVLMMSPASAGKYQDAINAAEEQLASLTEEADIYAAIAQLREAGKMYRPIIPKVNERFLIKHKASGLYLNISDGVKLSTTGTPVYLHHTDADTYYIYNTETRKYLGYDGKDKWTMTNTQDDDFAISVQSTNIYYILGENGYFGTDATTDGAAVYGDKRQNANSQWFIEYYVVAPLDNLGFDDGTFIDNGICTYDYDCAKNNTTYSGMQPVDSWDMGVANGNARAAAMFAWGSPAFLGGAGYVAPSESYTGATEGGALGIVAVWTGSVQYVQKTELAAGTYTISVPVYNTGGASDFVKNLIGFIANDGTEYLATSKSYPVGSWYLEQVTFTLNADTEGVISVGYTAANAGSGAMPHIFLDYVDIANGNPQNGGSSEEATAINAVSETSAPAAIYNANGAQLNSLQKGLNIVKYNNGQVKKIFVK